MYLNCLFIYSSPFLHLYLALPLYSLSERIILHSFFLSYHPIQIQLDFLLFISSFFLLPFLLLLFPLVHAILFHNLSFPSRISVSFLVTFPSSKPFAFLISYTQCPKLSSHLPSFASSNLLSLPAFQCPFLSSLPSSMFPHPFTSSCTLRQ